MERLSTQLSYNRSNARDIIATADALERMPMLVGICRRNGRPVNWPSSEGLNSLQDMAELIRRTMIESPPLGLRDGGLIRQGINPELDRLKIISNSGYDWFNQLESDLRKELDIPNLKVRNNRQIGWFIEVINSHLSKVP